MEQLHRLEYEVDLTKIEGTGDFPCPSCGVKLSPEDESESVYKVLDTKIKDGALEEVRVLCLACKGTIRLIGFVSP